MKLHDLESKTQVQKTQKMFESHFNKHMDFSNMGRSDAKQMLGKVQGLLKEYRNSPSFHRSEKSPAYLKLVIAEQGLSARLASQLFESDVQQAQVVMAAQDFVDRLQDMLEDISEMQFKDLPAVVNSIRYEVGTNEATQFNTDANAALASALSTMQQAKAQLESAIGIVTGNAPAAIPGEADADMEVDADTDFDIDADDEEADIDLDSDEEDAFGSTDTLGRERR